MPGGFVGDPDIFDTWATSSLTPQIAGGWRDAAGTGTDPLFEKVFPMDLRPQGHDIIRTWLFSTVVRSHFEHGSVPWTNAAISGWILDPDRKKMSKSRGNVVTPEDLLKEHSADAVRYWAASGRLGTDAAYDTGQIKVGRRLAIKVLNASKFALSFGETSRATSARWSPSRSTCRLLAGLRDVVARATAGFEAWDFTRALEVTEQWFWAFCDDYLELVKDRAYGAQGDAVAASARATLRISLDVVLRLLAPVLPYVTEEVWSWTHDGSVHRAAVADRRRGAGRRRRRAAHRRRRGAGRRAQGQVRGQGRHARRGALDDPRRAGRRARPRAGGGVRPASGGPLTGILEFAPGDEVGARDVELVPVARPAG